MALEGSSTTYISALWLVRVTKAASIGAFIVQSLELFNHIREEIDYLWRAPFRLMTCLYALARYFPLCVQIVNLTLSEIIHASLNPRSKLCLFTFTANIISCQLMSTCIETILMIRVHALYNCSRRTGIFLLAILISGTSLEVTGAALSVSGLRLGPQETVCSRKQFPIEVVITYIMGAGLIHATLLVMTISRVVLYRETGWMRTPLVSLILRDGIFVFLVWTIILAVFLTLEMVPSEDMLLLWNVEFSWYVAMLSIVGDSQYAKQMRKLGVQHPQNQQNTSYSVQLSSLFEEQSLSTPGDSTELF